MTATLNDGFTQTTATGGETTIDFDFLIYGKDDIAFYETDLSGVITLLVRGTDYSIADAELLDPSGGEIVLDVGVYPTGATAGHKFTCISDIAETRSSDFQQGGDFFAQTLNTNLDRLTRVTQQLRRDVDKKAGLPVDSTLAGITFTDAPQDGYGVIWDGVLGNFRNTASSLAVLEGNAATVAGIAAAVVVVAANDSDITTVANNLNGSDTIGTVAGLDTEIAALGPIAANITTVAGISAAVSTVATNIADINTVAGIAATVSTVATNIADINTAATNIAAIIAAPAAATEAFNWANYPEDSLVPEGNMTTEYSAYHWSKKAALTASGDGAGLSVLGVTGSSTTARADITAGSDHQVLRRSGTTLAFGAVNLAQSAAVTGILPTAKGGTANAFFTVSGPATSAKTYTFPNATCTVLTTNAAVTVAQGGTGLASTTAYGVICGGTTSTGAFQSVASVGTAGQVLTSNGAGALPTFQTANSGNWIKLGAVTASGAATVSFVNGVSGIVLDSTYKTYVIIGEDVLASVNSAALWFRAGTGEGPTYLTGSEYDYGRRNYPTAGTGNDTNATAQAQLLIAETYSNTNGETGTFKLVIGDPASANRKPVLIHDSHFVYSAQAFRATVGGGGVNTTTALTAFRIMMSTGNISGTFTLYGVTH
jgi:hypothetical protein